MVTNTMVPLCETRYLELVTCDRYLELDYGRAVWTMVRQFRRSRLDSVTRFPPLVTKLLQVIKITSNVLNSI